MADNHHRPARPTTSPVVRSYEQPAERRRHTECVEAAGARPYTFHELCFAAGAQIELGVELAPRERGGKAIALTLDLFPDRIRPRFLARRW